MCVDKCLDKSWIKKKFCVKHLVMARHSYIRGKYYGIDDGSFAVFYFLRFFVVKTAIDCTASLFILTDYRLMNIQQHIGKISWTVADKLLVIGYGFVNIVQIRSLGVDEFGLYSLLVALQTYIFILSDGSALQGIIQFGMKEEDRPQANYLALCIHCSIVVVASFLVLLLTEPLKILFNEPRLQNISYLLPIYCVLTLPRAFCLKLLQRDLQMRQIFLINLAWFGSMTVATALSILSYQVLSFWSMIIIAFTGMLISSLVSILLSRSLLVFNRSGELNLKVLLTFGIPQLAVSSLHNSVRQLDIYIIQYFFGATQVGIYTAAKTLFRVFETMADSVGGLLYPLTIKLYNTGKVSEYLNALSKGLSFTWIPSIFAVIILISGGTEIIVSILGNKYISAVGQFNILVLGAIFLPITVLSSVMIGVRAVTILLLYVVVSAIVGLSVSFFIGSIQRFDLFALGTVAYLATLAILELYFIISKMNFKWTLLFRAIPDSISYSHRKPTQ